MTTTNGTGTTKEVTIHVDQDPDKDRVIGDIGRDHFIRIDVEEDRSRLKSGAALLNTFNFAIQEQSGRRHWTEADFHRFIRAYVALDGIGREPKAEG